MVRGIKRGLPQSTVRGLSSVGWQGEAVSQQTELCVAHAILKIMQERGRGGGGGGFRLSKREGCQASRTTLVRAQVVVGVVCACDGVNKCVC